MKKFPVILCKKEADRPLHNRHPWLFSGAIKQMPAIENGEMVEIRLANDSLAGYGFYAPGNQIAVRMFEFTNQEVDVLSEEYWFSKLNTAYQIRKEYLISPQTNCYRLLHAEGDFFPGIIADVYNEVLVIQILIQGIEKILPQLLSAFKRLGFRHVYAKMKEVSERLENVSVAKGWLTPNPPDVSMDVLENGNIFRVNVETGQKTGFFLDQRDSRLLLKNYSKDKSVLNTFSFSGGFSVYALQGGARLVHSVDSSRSAIEMCDENIAINQFGDNRHQSFCSDTFDFLKSAQEKYDVIVLDPPAFAKSAKAVERASRGYKELNLSAMRMIKPGGVLFTFSCSQKIDKDLFRKIVFGAAADARRNVRVLHQTGHPLDHPINIFHPENEYLKGLVLLVE